MRQMVGWLGAARRDVKVLRTKQMLVNRRVSVGKEVRC